MSWKIKRGNTSIQEIPIVDKDGNAVTNLSSAEEIKFEVKESHDADPFIEKSADSAFGGIQVDMTQDGAEVGTLMITVLPEDTAGSGAPDPGNYVMGLQIKWSATLIWEVILKIDGVETKTFEIEDDVVK
jgi:hypothetical protein